jgi:hypothetical protein
MARLFLTNIDLKGNQLVNVVLHNLSGTSGLSTAVGAMYYDTGTNKFQFRQGSTPAWVGYQLDTTTLSGIPAPASSVSLNSQKITNLLDPSDPQDAATKAYVDGVAQGLDVKASVRVASTTNLSSLVTVSTPVDGVTLTAGDRVLLKNQSTAADNGIWVAALGNWSRAADGVTGKLTSGSFVFVEEGTVNQNSGWVLTTDGTITVGSTNLAWDQFSGAGQITAGNGLTKSGNTINFVGAGNGGLTVNADSVEVNGSQLFIGTSNVVVGATGGAQSLAGIQNITGSANDFELVPGNAAGGTTGYTTIIKGGLGGSGSTGGAITITGGAAGGGGTIGGAVTINGGAATTPGAVNIGTTSAAINIGQASVSTTIISGATRLAALTSNGFVKTSGSNGALSIDTTVALTTNNLSVFAATTSSQLAGVISDETGSGALVFGTGPTISLPSINNIKIGYTTTVTSGTTQTIDVNANRDRFYTGTTAQTVVLPVASTLTLGMSYEFHNNSTAVLTVQSSGLNTVVTIPPLTTVRITCILTSGTDATSWDFDFTGQNAVPVRKVVGTIALTAATPAAITHNLATRDINVQMWETTSSLPTNVVEMDVTSTSTTQATVTSSLTGTYYYVIMG